MKEMEPSNSLNEEKNESFHIGLGEVLLEQDGIDCIFEVLYEETNAWKQIGAHKIVLSAESPIFKKLFQEKWKDKDLTNIIRLPNVTYQALMWLLW